MPVKFPLQTNIHLLYYAANLFINLIFKVNLKGRDMEPTVPETLSRAAPVFVGIFALFVVLASLIVSILMVWAYCRIFSKAGYSWALGLLMLVPIANIIMPFILAFGNWPIYKELHQLRQQQSNTTG